jgi:CRISPR/Cas system-associated exonuclease Cas4 (RecB family)
MTPNSPYDLREPSKWAQPPKQFSFSSLQTLAACPRRWQLLHSEWGVHPRFPDRAYPSAVEGQIVHEALDLLYRALGRAGRPPLGSADFNIAASSCDFWGFFTRQIDEWNSRAALHPRAGPGFVIRTQPRELANRAVRLFREQYRPGGQGTVVPKQESGAKAGSVMARLRRNGALSEVRLEHPTLPLGGVLDLVSCGEGEAVSILDFKTGAAKESHRDQLLLYALLWWRVTGVRPARIAVQYLNDGWIEDVSEIELSRFERRVAEEISQLAETLSKHPARARAGQQCVHCPVRARCSEGWSYVEPAGALVGRTVDCEMSVSSQPVQTGFTGRRRDGREVSVVYDAAVAATLPILVPQGRIRVIDAVLGDGGKSIELRAWSECYLL